MDVINFQGGGVPYGMVNQGRFVHGIKKKMWVERFSTPGEFSFEGPVSAGLREQMPLNSLVSHRGTADLMIVENHELSDQTEGEPIVKVTGRNFITFLENRVLQEARATFTGDTDPRYTLLSAYPEEQIMLLLHDHIGAEPSEMTFDPLVWIRYVALLHPPVLSSEYAAERVLDPGYVLPVILEILKTTGLGIKVLRPGHFHPGPYTGDIEEGHEELVYPGKPKIGITVTAPWNRTDEVILSHASGDIKDADYLWSAKTDKNIAMVTSKWFKVLATATGDAGWSLRPGYLRRTLHVDASELDKDYSTAPTSGTRTAIINKMKALGTQMLNSQNVTEITRVEAVENLSRYKYRRDFDVGDIIRVDAKYNTSATAQVIEYVEIEDENGERGYPTLRISNE